MSEILNTFIEVQLKNDEDFLKIAETLTRIGVASNTENRLFQTCHVLHKQGRYYLVHFKEMLALDGNNTNYSDEDRARRNRIATLLEQWNLLTIVNPNIIDDQADISKIKIISFADKKNWQLERKYNIGRKF